MSTATAPATPAAAPAAPKPQKNPYWKAVGPFALGGVSGMFATCIIQPIDMVKVRIQLLGEGGAAVGSKNPLSLATKVIQTEGFFSLYKGLSAALLRQATYTTARMGIWKKTNEALARTENGGPLPFWKKSLSGLVAGGLGAMCGTPADVALIRMQADNTLPPNQRRNYKHVGDALARILREEGVIKGLFAGNGPVVLRAMSLNVGMLATYDQVRESAAPYCKTTAQAENVAKLLAGFFASAFSLPFDFVKTRIQKQKKGPDGQYPYKGFLHCAGKVAKEEGLFAFYRGFWTYYIRIAPHAMITLAALEQLQKFTKDW